jgi:putative membrane protein
MRVKRQPHEAASLSRVIVGGGDWSTLVEWGTDEPNMSDELANDRTFLAWLRTGIALFGFGFVVAKLALLAAPTSKAASNQGLYGAFGILIVLSGGAVVVVGYLQHKAVLDVLRTDEAKPRSRWSLTMTATAVVGSLLLSVLLAVST